MRRLSLILVTVAVAATACASSDPNVRYLADELRDVTTDTNRSVAELFSVLGLRFDDSAQAFQRLANLRLPPTAAINLDRAQKVEPPPGSEADFDRYLTFLTEYLAATEALDQSVADEDPVGALVAELTVEVSAGALAVSLPADTCVRLVPAIASDLCDPLGRPGYESLLSFELRRFAVSFRPLLQISEAFGPHPRDEMLESLHSEAAVVLAEARQRIGALVPEAEYRGLHQILLDHFDRLTAYWNSLDPSATTYAEVVRAINLDRTETRPPARAERDLIATEVTDTKIGIILDIWLAAGFDPVGDE